MSVPLKHYRSHSAEVLVICNCCLHRSELSREQLIKRFGENFPITDLGKYMRCTQCGSKKAQSRPAFPAVNMGLK